MFVSFVLTRGGCCWKGRDRGCREALTGAGCVSTAAAWRQRSGPSCWTFLRKPHQSPTGRAAAELCRQQGDTGDSHPLQPARPRPGPGASLGAVVCHGGRCVFLVVFVWGFFNQHALSDTFLIVFNSQKSVCAWEERMKTGWEMKWIKMVEQKKRKKKQKTFQYIKMIFFQ